MNTWRGRGLKQWIQCYVSGELFPVLQNITKVAGPHGGRSAWWSAHTVVSPHGGRSAWWSVHTVAGLHGGRSAWWSSVHCPSGNANDQFLTIRIQHTGQRKRSASTNMYTRTYIHVYVCTYHYQQTSLHKIPLKQESNKVRIH